MGKGFVDRSIGKEEIFRKPCSAHNPTKTANSMKVLNLEKGFHLDSINIWEVVRELRGNCIKRTYIEIFEHVHVFAYVVSVGCSVMPSG